MQCFKIYLFFSQSGGCVPAASLCDGVIDCTLDSSDEMECQLYIYDPPVQSFPLHPCPDDGHCVVHFIPNVIQATNYAYLRDSNRVTQCIARTLIT